MSIPKEASQVLTKKTTYPGPIATGFALFSMFFGAGNLVFPLILGHQAGENSGFAIFGLAFSAVIVPLLGLISMTLYQGNIIDFFGRLGKIPSLIVIFIMHAMVGPFGVVPRIITLMHATLLPFFPKLTMGMFSVIIGGLLLLGSLKKDKLVRFLGVYCSPLFLLSLGTLVVIGIVTSQGRSADCMLPQESFFKGLTSGYATMDLIAAFLLTSAIIPQFKKDPAVNSDPSGSLLTKKMLKASYIAAGLLLLSYVALTIISSCHTWTLATMPAPEGILGAVSTKLLGRIGAMVACFAVCIACYSTSVSLTAIFGGYISRQFTNNKLHPFFGSVLGVIIAGSLANLGFKKLASILGPILEVLYPALIVMSVINICYQLYRFKPIKMPIAITVVLSFVGYLLMR